jgi:hypothetical protein
MDTQRGDEMLGFHPYFDIQQNSGVRVVSSTHRPHFTPKDIPWHSFLLVAEWTPGLLNADQTGRPENFQGPHRESKPGPPISWRLN